MEKGCYTGKIVVVGAGNVGATVAYTLLLRHLGNEIVLVDVAKDKASGEALDLQHATSFYTSAGIRDGDYDECADADVIVVTAGVGRKPGQTRIELAQTNAAIAKSIAAGIKQYAKDPVVVVISNPVDIITYVIQKETGIPANRCFGSGTSLDTARLRYACAAQLDMDARDMNIYVVGEHGDSMVPVWSCANAAGAPLKELIEASGASCEEIMTRTVDGGAEIIRKKGATFYGVSNAAAKIVAAILGDEDAVVSVTKVQEGEFMGISDVAVSLPYIVNKTGIVKSVPLAMDDAEKEGFKTSAGKLKEVIVEVLGVK